MIRCALIDDEVLARRNLAVLLEPHADFEVVFECGRAREALEHLIATPPDLVFLDVRMPELSGMEILGRLHERLDAHARPYVVLVTAFDRYALQAFTWEALDYLVKPVEAERFHRTLARARQRIARCPDSLSMGASPAPQDVVTLRCGSETLRIPRSEIVWIESADHYVYVHALGRSYLARATLTRLERDLQDHTFLRVHRGALVNLDQVRVLGVDTTGHPAITLIEGTSIPVSRRRLEEVRERVRGMSGPSFG